MVLVVDRTAGARGALCLGEHVVLLDLGAVEALLKDGLGLVDLELGLEVMEMVRVAAAVGAAASVGELELLVDDLLARRAPVAAATSVLLGLLGVNTVEAALGEELGKILMRDGGALGQAGVVLLVELVRSSHVEWLDGETGETGERGCGYERGVGRLENMATEDESGFVGREDGR